MFPTARRWRYYKTEVWLVEVGEVNEVHLVQNTKSSNSSKADYIYPRSYNLVSLRQLLISFLIQVLNPQRDISFFSQKNNVRVVFLL